MIKIAAAFAEIALLANLSPEMLAGLRFARAIRSLLAGYAYEIEDGCLKNLDYDAHKRAKSWIATVRPNRASPGGLDRDFWRHGSGAWYAIPATGLRAGDVIEMAGDAVSARGNRTRDRRYVLVVRVEDGYIVGSHMGDTAPSTKRVAAARTEIGVAA